MVFTNEYIRDLSKNQFQFFYVDLNHNAQKKGYMYYVTMHL
jgi:hypothetical protein